jgi:hypothetical protein
MIQGGGVSVNVQCNKKMVLWYVVQKVHVPDLAYSIYTTSAVRVSRASNTYRSHECNNVKLQTSSFRYGAGEDPTAVT